MLSTISSEGRETFPFLPSYRYPLHITLPKKEINTGYGLRFGDGEQGLAYFVELAEKTDFKVVSRSPTKGWFFLEFKKPA